MGEGGCFCTEGDGVQAVRRKAEIKWAEMDVFLNEYQEDERSLVANFKPPRIPLGNGHEQSLGNFTGFFSLSLSDHCVLVR